MQEYKKSFFSAVMHEKNLRLSIWNWSLLLLSFITWKYITFLDIQQKKNFDVYFFTILAIIQFFLIIIFKEVSIRFISYSVYCYVCFLLISKKEDDWILWLSFVLLFLEFPYSLIMLIISYGFYYYRQSSLNSFFL